MTGLTEYTDASEAADWLAVYSNGLPEQFKPIADAWVKLKRAYEAEESADRG